MQQATVATALFKSVKLGMKYDSSLEGVYECLNIPKFFAEKCFRTHCFELENKFNKNYQP